MRTLLLPLLLLGILASAYSTDFFHPPVGHPCGRARHYRTRVPYGVGLDVDDCGAYQVTLAGDTWLHGTDGLKARVAGGSIVMSSPHPDSPPELYDGVDSVGHFSAESFRWTLEAPYSGGSVLTLRVTTGFRVYEDLGLVVFSQSFPDGVANASLGTTDAVVMAFPSFDFGEVQGMRFGTYNYSFARPQIGDIGTSVPVTGILGGVPLVLYDPDHWTIVLSPFANYMAGLHVWQDGHYACGINGMTSSLPQGFAHETVVAGGRGIGRTVESWGDALLRRTGKPRQRQDVTTRYIGYWTGSGSYYKYLTEPGKTFQQTMVDVYQWARSVGVPLRYIQLDSLWYPHDTDLTSNGTVKHGNFSTGSQQGQVFLWEPYAPEVFPDMAHFHLDIDRAALVLHTRMISVKSPYCIPASQGGQGFRCLVSAARKEALPLEEAFWDHVWSPALDWEFEVFLLDWAKETAFMPEAMRDIATLPTWLGAMDRVAMRRGLTVMLSEPLPSHILQTTELHSFTTCRVSGDYQPGRTNYYMFYTGILARVLGMVGFKQTYWSSDSTEPNCKSDYDTCREPNAELNVLVAALSAGTFTPSDKIGYLNATRLARGIRSDGLILKPDALPVPFDFAFVSSPSSPPDRPGDVFQEGFDQFVYTHTSYRSPKDSPGVADLEWYYVLLINSTRQVTVTTSDLVDTSVPYSAMEAIRLASRRFASYDMYDPTLSLTPVGPFSPLRVPRLNNGSSVTRFDVVPFAYRVLCPILSNGWVLLGETAKYVPVSKQRIAQVTPSEDGLDVDLAGAPGETVTLRFAPSEDGPILSASCTFADVPRITLSCRGGTDGSVSCACAA